MSYERRNYKRYQVNIDVSIYVGDSEIDCKAVDISEDGICFKIPAQYEDAFSVNNYITFQLFDSFLIGTYRETQVVCEKVSIRHIEKRGDFIYVGCLVSSECFRRYAIHKEISLFIV